jgi:glycosyltransferase involved in cell wall biosynthesis
VEQQQNRGQTPTINKGWERAKGDILTWLNSDDTFLPEAVDRAVKYLRAHKDVDIVFGDTLFTREDGTPIEQSRRLDGFDYRQFVLSCENPIPQPSAFIRRSVIEDIGLLDPSYYYFMDWDFWLRAGIRHRIAYLPETLSTYRLHAQSKTVAYKAKAAPELEYMYSKFFARDDLPAEIRRVERQAMVNMFFSSGGYYLLGGNPKAAARMGLKALRSSPLSFYRPSMIHKLAYCLVGGRPLYQRTRDLYYKALVTFGGRSVPSQEF